MAFDRTHTEGDASLHPSRWPPRLTGGSTLRWVLAAVLLLLAFGVLQLRQPTCVAPEPTGVLGLPGPGPSGTAGSPDDPSGTARPPGGRAGPGAAADGQSRRDTAPDGPDPALPVPAGTVGVPIRLAEPAALVVARPGVRVDLLAVPEPARAAGKPLLVAGRALVLDVLGPEEGALYLALRPEQARRAVAMPGTTRFSIIVQP
ncbi:flagellar biosynthesis protein FlgA [Plantactinospora sonchi]|uniref:Flagellar biosynthesis protein FlgA n=1 Tax=Plantactinospora sonchi TaxID=1544735 RepID=A0ABU7RSJ8_9ACTN